MNVENMSWQSNKLLFVNAAALSDGDYVHAAILHSDVTLLVGKYGKHTVSSVMWGQRAVGVHIKCQPSRSQS